MEQTITNEVAGAIARHEAWLERHCYPRVKSDLEINNVKINSLWVTADVTVTKNNKAFTYKGNVYPYWLLQQYMDHKRGAYYVNQGGSA